tara:strand:- start:57456 stop:57710 length:255 start_codon:yes stop_codon:yes gene_type:complete
MCQIKKDQNVLIQFGYNHDGPSNYDPGIRVGIRGIGEEIDRSLSDRHVVVHSYGWYLGTMVAEIKESGAIPIIRPMFLGIVPYF